jgi:hypothetical protein
LHKTAEALRKVDALGKAAMREVDAFCLTTKSRPSRRPALFGVRAAPRLCDPPRCLKYVARRGNVPSGKGS